MSGAPGIDILHIPSLLVSSRRRWAESVLHSFCFSCRAVLHAQGYFEVITALKLFAIGRTFLCIEAIDYL